MAKKETKTTEQTPAETSEALAVTSTTTSALAPLDYGDDAGMGLEDTGKGRIPWIILFQSNSPQVEEGLVPGAKAGNLFNSATNELIDAEIEPGQSDEGKGLVIQLVYVQRTWVEWIPRESGGGVAARYTFDRTLGFDQFIVDAIKKNGGSEIFDKKNPLRGKVAAENNVVDTRYVYFNILDAEGRVVDGQGVMACSSSKIAPLEKLVQALKQAKGQPPPFAARLRLTTFQDKQKKPPNKVYKNIRFSAFDPRLELPYAKRSQRFIPEIMLSQNDDLYQAGRAFYMEIKAGEKQADYDKENLTSVDRAEGEDASEKRAF